MSDEQPPNERERDRQAKMERGYASITEKDWQRQVIETARWGGWLVYHTFDSRRSNAGFPDLVLVHERRKLIVFAELKTERGKLTSDQQVWQLAITWAGGDHRVWRPSDVNEVTPFLIASATTEPGRPSSPTP